MIFTTPLSVDLCKKVFYFFQFFLILFSTHFDRIEKELKINKTFSDDESFGFNFSEASFYFHIYVLPLCIYAVHT